MVNSYPEPQITWYKNGEELRVDFGDSGKYQMSSDGRELIIANKNIDDTARYTCIARNLAGEAQKNFDVEIHGTLRDIVDIVVELMSLITHLLQPLGRPNRVLT